MKLDMYFYLTSISSTLLSLCVGIFVFSMVIHENGHAFMCLLFGVRILFYSFVQVVSENVQNPIARVAIGLSGGLAGGTSSMVLFYYETRQEEAFLAKTLVEKAKGIRESMVHLGYLFGIELTLLALTFQGILGGIWEGLFHANYQVVSLNTVMSIVFLVCCFILSYCFMRERFHRLTRREE